MTKTNLKAAAVIATALAATGCASRNTAFDQATGLGNQALSSFTNQTFDTATVKAPKLAQEAGVPSKSIITVPPEGMLSKTSINSRVDCDMGTGIPSGTK